MRGIITMSATTDLTVTNPSSITDLLGSTLTPAEAALLDTYRALKAIAAQDLPPSTAANVRVALSALGIALTDAVIDFEHLTDLGC
ncbi:hypothetical protein A5777_01990 [Gordonia sp. 852002-10350_SCH5691597]|nr:hypothetical protein A5777_01990 [Gordonia sp. 852002-10350_SCH5691597]